MKKLLLTIIIGAILISSIGIVSAALCKDSNGYYTDCQKPFNHRYQGDSDKSSASKFLETHTINSNFNQRPTNRNQRPSFSNNYGYNNYGYNNYGYNNNFFGGGYDSYSYFGQPGYIGGFGYGAYGYPFFSGGYRPYFGNGFGYGLGYGGYYNYYPPGPYFNSYLF